MNLRRLQKSKKKASLKHHFKLHNYQKKDILNHLAVKAKEKYKKKRKSFNKGLF